MMNNNKFFHSVFASSTLLAAVFLSSCGQDLSVDIKTKRVTPDFNVTVYGDNDVYASARFTNADTRAQIVLVDPETVTVTADTVTHNLDFFELLGFVSYSKSFAGSTVPGTEYRFSWSRFSNGANAENSVVELPVEPTLTIMGSDKVVIDDTVTLTWPTDPVIDTIQYSSHIMRCGVSFNSAGNWYYPQPAVGSPNPWEMGDTTINQTLSDTGQITINTRSMLSNPSSVITQIGKLKFVDTSLIDYCAVSISVQRTQTGHLDSKYVGGKITAVRDSTIILFINVDSLKP